MSISQLTKWHKHRSSKTYLPAGTVNMILFEAHDKLWQQRTYPRGGDGSSRARRSPKLRYTTPDSPRCTRRSGSCKGGRDRPTKQIYAIRGSRQHIRQAKQRSPHMGHPKGRININLFKCQRHHGQRPHTAHTGDSSSIG